MQLLATVHFLLTSIITLPWEQTLHVRRSHMRSEPYHDELYTFREDTKQRRHGRNGGSSCAMDERHCGHDMMTIKFLTGITPEGSVSFLSRAYCGRISDKHITDHSGFLEKILPSDIVLADRGFDIQESVGLKGAEVKSPSFTKRRAQMNAFEIESTRNIAHVRIHVERVIGLVRNKYTILSGILPLDYMQSSGSEIPILLIRLPLCAAVWPIYVNLSCLSTNHNHTSWSN